MIKLPTSAKVTLILIATLSFLKRLARSCLIRLLYLVFFAVVLPVWLVCAKILYVLIRTTGG